MSSVSMAVCFCSNIQLYQCKQEVDTEVNLFSVMVLVLPGKYEEESGARDGPQTLSCYGQSGFM